MRVRRGLLRLPRRSLLAALFFFSLSSSLLYFVYVAPGIGKTGVGGVAVASRGPREPPPRHERTPVFAGLPARRRPRAWETESYGDLGLTLGRRQYVPALCAPKLRTPAACCPPNPILMLTRRAFTQLSFMPGRPLSRPHLPRALTSRFSARELPRFLPWGPLKPRPCHSVHPNLSGPLAGTRRAARPRARVWRRPTFLVDNPPLPPLLLPRD